MARIGNTFSTVIVANLNNATETVVATCGPISPVIDGGVILVLFSILVQMAGSTTGITLRLRQGITASGTLLFSPGFSTLAAAGQNVNLCGFGFDVNAGADQMYCLTGVAVSGVGNSTVGNVAMMAMSL